LLIRTHFKIIKWEFSLMTDSYLLFKTILKTAKCIIHENFLNCVSYPLGCWYGWGVKFWPLRILPSPISKSSNFFQGIKIFVSCNIKPNIQHNRLLNSVVLLLRKIKITSAAENIFCDVSNDYTNPSPTANDPRDHMSMLYSVSRSPIDETNDSVSKSRIVFRNGIVENLLLRRNFPPQKS